MDNPVNSEIALDLGLCAHQDVRRTGERNADRGSRGHQDQQGHEEQGEAADGGHQATPAVDRPGRAEPAGVRSGALVGLADC